MNYSLPCEIYAKFAQLAINANDPNWRCVRIEHASGKKYAIASDRFNAVIYFLGDTDQPDGSINVVADANMIAACVNETPYKSNLEIIALPGIGASAKTTFGFIYSGNAMQFDDKTELARWRTLYEPVKKSRGAMFWNIAGIAQLAAASISGSIRFPEFIDAGKPVLVRDVIDENWFGLFMPTRFADGQSQEVEPATLPAWVKL